MSPTKSKRILKGQVFSLNDLKQYLRQEAKSNKRLYHYTTYESIIEIIKNKSFQLTRLDLLNDKAEKKLGFHDDSFENYVISFTQEKEYISMWAMYGKASGIKLRLDFDNAIFKNISPSIYTNPETMAMQHFYDKADLWDMDNPNVVLSDIGYIDKRANKIKHNTNPFDFLPSKYDLSSLTGLIKYDAWEFEKETRLKIRLSGDRTLKDYGYPEHIYYSISDELIKSFHITFNPWMSNNLKNEIRKSLNALSGYELLYSDSGDDGEVSEL